MALIGQAGVSITIKGLCKSCEDKFNIHYGLMFLQSYYEICRTNAV